VFPTEALPRRKQIGGPKASRKKKRKERTRTRRSRTAMGAGTEVKLCYRCGSRCWRACKTLGKKEKKGRGEAISRSPTERKKKKADRSGSVRLTTWQKETPRRRRMGISSHKGAARLFTRPKKGKNANSGRERGNGRGTARPDLYGTRVRLKGKDSRITEKGGWGKRGSGKKEEIREEKSKTCSTGGPVYENWPKSRPVPTSLR